MIILNSSARGRFAWPSVEGLGKKNDEIPIYRVGLTSLGFVGITVIVKLWQWEMV